MNQGKEKKSWKKRLRAGISSSSAGFSSYSALFSSFSPQFSTSPSSSSTSVDGLGLVHSTFPSFEDPDSDECSTPISVSDDVFTPVASSSARNSDETPFTTFSTPREISGSPRSDFGKFSRASAAPENALLSPFRFKPAASPSPDSPPVSPKGPKLKPFILTHTQQTTPSVNKATATDVCFICGELLINNLEAERLVPLTCGDSVHGNCYEVAAEFQSADAHLQPRGTIKCTGKRCANSPKENYVSPKDGQLYDAVVPSSKSNILEKIKQPKITRSSSAPESSRLFVPLPQLPPVPSKLAAKNYFEPSVFNPQTPSESSFTRNLRRKSQARGRSVPEISDDPSLMSMSSSRSSSPASTICTKNTVTVKINQYKKVSLDTLKNNFIRHLLDTCKSFSLTTLLRLGTLRLVDKLLVSYDSTEYSEKTVYLCDNYLVVCDETTSDDDYVLIEMDHTQISTPSASILKISVADLQVWLHSQTDSIIEKWGVAMCDRTFEFPVEIFSSTIILPKFRGSQTSSLAFPPPVRNSVNSMYSQSSNDTEYSSDATIHLCSDSKPSEATTIVVVNNASSNENSESKIRSELESPLDQKLFTKLERSSRSSVVDNDKVDSIFKSKNSAFSITIESDSNSDEIDDSESSCDEDSDVEIIADLISKSQLTPSKEIEKGWNELISHVDSALSVACAPY